MSNRPDQYTGQFDKYAWIAAYLILGLFAPILHGIYHLFWGPQSLKTKHTSESWRQELDKIDNQTKNDDLSPEQSKYLRE
jgi:hypothetical protein